MQHINLYFKFVLRNVFVTIVKKKRILWNQSMGKLLFKNKNKTLLEGFKLLVISIVNYISKHNLILNCIYLNYLPKIKLKIIKKYFNFLEVQKIKLVQKFNHNGCRLKKQKRSRNNIFLRNKFKL